jgi:hypothetical protein
VEDVAREGRDHVQGCDVIAVDCGEG